MAAVRRNGLINAHWADGGFEFSSLCVDDARNESNSAEVEIYGTKFRIDMEGPSMKGTVAIAVTALGALAVAACGSSSSSSGSGGGSAAAGGTSTKACVASIGMEGPLTGPVANLGQEQL